MIRKIIIAALALFILVNTASAIDSSDWNETTVGYETFKIPTKYSDNIDKNNPNIEIILPISFPQALTK